MTRYRYEDDPQFDPREGDGMSEPMKMTQPYPNEALTDICKQLLDDWDLTPEQIGNLAMDIAGECDAIMEDRWMDFTNREPDDSSYRRDMIAAGRGHLLK